MTKTVGQRVDQIEEVMGSVQSELQRSSLDNQREFSSLREEILLMNKRLELILNQRRFGSQWVGHDREAEGEDGRR